jgi:hypothetical protein
MKCLMTQFYSNTNQDVDWKQLICMIKMKITDQLENT